MPRNHGIISHVVKRHGAMAQSVEHIVHIDGVVGSSPTGTTQIKESPLVGGSFICLSRLIRTCGTLRGERTSTGRKTARCQWQKQRGFALIDRAQRDRRFESYWHHANKRVTPCGWLFSVCTEYVHEWAAGCRLCSPLSQLTLTALPEGEPQTVKKPTGGIGGLASPSILHRKSATCAAIFALFV